MPVVAAAAVAAPPDASLPSEDEAADIAAFEEPLRRLRRAGLKATRQRLALARLLFGGLPGSGCDGGGPHRHVTAEQLHAEAVAQGIPVSLATVYNTLHQFTAAGLLRKVTVHQGQLYFDTNTADHHHLFHPRTGRLQDTDPVTVVDLPAAPAGSRIARVDVVIHLADDEDDDQAMAAAVVPADGRATT